MEDLCDDRKTRNTGWRDRLARLHTRGLAENADGCDKVSVGEQAFDFSLDLHDFSEGVEQKTGRSFNLLEVASEKPVALVFGSYT
jgi:hypothetical protein